MVATIGDDLVFRGGGAVNGPVTLPAAGQIIRQGIETVGTIAP